jgi:drug/metabolite transporter (DMT)-like permease
MNFGSATKAYSYADLSVLMPFVFSRLIFSSIFAFFLFSEMLDAWTALGSFIIVFGSVYVAYKEKRKNRIKVYED